MSHDEAAREAVRRWGFSAFTESNAAGFFGVGFRNNEYPTRSVVKGTGLSWEAAFADADRREEAPSRD